jgi:nitrite reductase (NADH) small subunit
MTEVTIEESEVPLGASKIIKVNGLEIGVFNVDGRYYALLNRCPHQGGPVCTGRISGTVVADESTEWKTRWVKDGEMLYCPWHGFEFDITDGRCNSREGVSLRAYKASAENGLIKIQL